MLDAASTRAATEDPFSDVARDGHLRLLEYCEDAPSTSMAFVAYSRLAAHCGVDGQGEGTWLWWMKARARVEGADRGERAAAAMCEIARAEGLLAELQNASDQCRNECQTGPDAVRAHEGYFEFARTHDLRSHRAVAADRLTVVSEARGDISMSLQWALAACAAEASDFRSERVTLIRDREARLSRLLPELEKLNSSEVYVRVGKEYRLSRKVDDAIVIYLAGRARFPESTALLNALAGGLRDACEPGLARMQVSRSLEIEPSFDRNPAAHTVFGLLCFDQGEVAEAISIGRSLVARHPSDAHVLRLLARAFLASGDYEAFTWHVERLSECSVDAKDTLKWLVSMRAKFARDPSKVSLVVPVDVAIEHVRGLRQRRTP